jgi:hypothetical protein
MNVNGLVLKVAICSSSVLFELPEQASSASAALAAKTARMDFFMVFPPKKKTCASPQKQSL